MENKLSVAILCYNTQIKLSNSLFGHVTLWTVLNLEKCSMEIVNVTMFENTHPLSPLSDWQQTIVALENSTGELWNIVFADNNGRVFIHVQSGEIRIQNITFDGNEMRKMINIIVSYIVLANVTVINNKGGMIRINKSQVTILSSRWEKNTFGSWEIEGFLSISQSYVETNGLLFKGNFF